MGVVGIHLLSYCLWGEIPQSRMPPLPIIEAFDKVEDRTARLIMGPEGPSDPTVHTPE